MSGWWAWMTITPVLLIVIFAFVVYVAVRLGVHEGKRDQ